MANSQAITAEQMKSVLEVSRLLAVTTDIDHLFTRIAHAVTAILLCERASIFLHDPTKDELWTKVALHSAEIRIPAGAGIAGNAFKSGEMLHVPDPYNDPRFNPEPDRRSGFRTRNLLSVPMVNIDRKPIGVVQAVNKKDGGFTDNDQAMIQLLADQAGVAFQRHRLQLDALEVFTLRHEMELAKDVQVALIPRAAPVLAGIESGGWTNPADLTGGDCFDLWETHDGRLGIFLGDASGHGLAPALVVSQARTLVRALSELEPDPFKLLSRVNARLAEDLEAARFVTAFLGFLDKDGWLNWTSAGHAPILLRTGRGQPMQILDAAGPPLATMPEFFGDQIPPVQMVSGGMLAVLSDGVFEAPIAGATGERFEVERVVQILDAHQASEPQTVIAVIRDTVQLWQGKVSPVDDQSIVIVKWK